MGFSAAGCALTTATKLRCRFRPRGGEFLAGEQPVFVAIGSGKKLSGSRRLFFECQKIITIFIERLERLGPATHHLQP